MSKLFTYKDNLGSLLKKSPSPFELKVSDPIYEGYSNISRRELEGFRENSEVDDYVSLSNSDYSRTPVLSPTTGVPNFAIYSEKSKDTPYAKYTIVSQHPENTPISTNISGPGITPQSDSDHVHRDGLQLSQSNLEYNGAKDNDPIIKDVIVSKQFEESYMSTINRVYIGSLTIVGLYVLFRYLKE
jgi:hypothetical protein